MKRKGSQLSMTFQNKQLTTQKIEALQQNLTVTINLNHHNSLLLSVPMRCNMKILKSMIWFHLKKSLPLRQYSRIIGFETQNRNYEIDYLLENGIGELESNIFLNCLHQVGNNGTKSITDYKICKLLSIGGFSKVYLLRDTENGSFKAGKFMLKQSSNAALVFNQFQISRGLDHPYILKTHLFLETQHFFIFIMDFYPGGQLFQLLKSNRHMAQEKARVYIVQVLLALRYLQQKSIVYRDIKPENMIIDTEGHIKLVDFGLAKRITDKSYSFCGSLDYMAPQMVKNEGHSFQVDYYSVGNLLFQILVGSPPFYHPNFSQQQTKEHIINSSLRFPDGLKLTSQVKDLLSKLLVKNPQKRLGVLGGVTEILGHSWFSDINEDQFLNRIVDAPIKPNFNALFQSQLCPQAQTQWISLIQNDLNEQKQRVKQISSKKLIKGNRHRSLNSQFNDYSYKNTRSPSKQIAPKVSSKLKANMSLLFVLTHKRANSQTNFHKIIPSNRNPFAVKSLNQSRKSSVFLKAHSRKASSDDNYLKTIQIQENLRNSINLICGQASQNKINKGQKIKKKRKQSRVFFKVKN